MRTKVYEHRHGIYKFEETAGTELRSEQTLDDGRFELAENQAETVMGDCASSQFAASRPAASSMLIMEDVGMEPASSPQKPRSEPRNSSSAAGPKREREKDDSSSDDVAPVDRMMGGDRRKKKAKVESKGKGQGRGSTVGESPSASVSGVVSTDKGVAELVEEAKRLMEDFKDATTVADIKAESMASLSSRIQSKRNGLGKKTGNKKTQFHIQNMDLLISNKSQIAASVDLHKALVVFEKKRIRKLATAVLDKLHAMKSAGVQMSQIPSCVLRGCCLASVFIAANDQQWKECVRLCSDEVITESILQENISELPQVQRAAVSAFFTEAIKSNPEPSNLQRLRLNMDGWIRELHQVGVHADVAAFLNAISAVLNHKGKNIDDVNKAVCLL